MMTSAKPKHTLILGSTVLTVLLFFSCSCHKPHTPPKAVFSCTGATMGTTYCVKVAGTLDTAQQAAVTDTVATVLADVDAMMSTYKADSDLSRFNASQSTEPFALATPLLQVFACALQVAEESKGAFDITVGPLVNAWGFGPELQDHAPDEKTLEALQRRVGYKKLSLDLDHSTVRKTQPDVYCDLSALAKGYAVDAVLAALAPYPNVMVEVGGEVRTRGCNAQGAPWRIAIEKPVTGQRSIQHVLPLSNVALATSGDYRNFYIEGGRRRSHTIDPRTAQPVSHTLASVSVVHAQCMWADAYATALTVLGPDEGYQFACRHQLAACFITRDGDGFVERMTPAFEKVFPQ